MYILNLDKTTFVDTAHVAMIKIIPSVNSTYKIEALTESEYIAVLSTLKDKHLTQRMFNNLIARIRTKSSDYIDMQTIYDEEIRKVGD